MTRGKDRDEAAGLLWEYGEACYELGEAFRDPGVSDDEYDELEREADEIYARLKRMLEEDAA